MADYTAEQIEAAAKKAEAAGATDDAAALRALLVSEPDATLGNHAMSGVNKGIAGILGAPVDMVNAGVNTVLPKSWESQRPFLGSDMIQDAMTKAGAITAAEPNTRGERMVSRIGEEVGAYAIPGAGLIGKSTKIGRDALAMLAQALSGGTAAASANEVFPGNELADIVASILGGGGVIAGSHAMRPNPNRVSAEDLASDVDQAYTNVRADTGTINPQPLEELVGALRARTAAEGLHPELAPRANASLSTIENAFGPAPRGTNYARTPPTIADIDKERQMVSNNVIMSGDPNEARLGAAMRDEIDQFLKGIQPADVTGGNPSMTVTELHRARELANRQFKADKVTKREASAELSAQTSGTGGNEVNRIRQEVKWLIDPKYPERAKGFSKQEREMMELIARGGPVENLLRVLSAFSPGTGKLQAGGYGLAFGSQGADPLLMSLAAGGYGAQKLGEVLTKSKVDALVDALRSGGKTPPKGVNAADQRMFDALMLSHVGQQ